MEKFKSTLMKRLEKQLTYPEHKKDAEDVIKIYNWIKETDPEGRVWGSRFNSLTDVSFKGYPSSDRTYKPNSAGYMVLKGLEKK